jgi:hypothetical protein
MAISNKIITVANPDNANPLPPALRPNAIFTAPGTRPAVQEHAVTCLFFCNVSNDDVELTVHVIPYQVARSDIQKVIHLLTVPAGETFTFDTEKLVLETGDTIVAYASADSRLVATISSMRLS